jgi:hypothetical protein
VPQGNPFTSLNLSGLPFLVRTRGHRSDWWGAPVRPVHSTCRSCTSHISLIWTPIWTFHIWILIYSTRPIQWWSPNCISWSLTTPVGPVGPTGLTGQTRRANFGCEQTPQGCSPAGLSWTCHSFAPFVPRTAASLLPTCHSILPLSSWGRRHRCRRKARARGVRRPNDIHEQARWLRAR